MASSNASQRSRVGVRMNRSAEWSNGLDTALYKTYFLVRKSVIGYNSHIEVKLI